MANYSPIKAIASRKNKKKEINTYDIYKRNTKELVFTSKSSIKASEFLGAYRLYLFHVKNKHRKYRPHNDYDVYINGVKQVSNNEALHKDKLVRKGMVYKFRFNGFRRLEIVSMEETKNDRYDIYVKVDDLPEKYFCFSKRHKPTYRNLINRIKNKLE
jgi:hypothetical protein